MHVELQLEIQSSEAYAAALAGDPVSAFGGVLITNVSEIDVSNG